MTLRSKVASALSFAHLAGIGNRAKVEDDNPDKKDEDKVKSKGKAEDDDPEKKDQDHEDGDSKQSKAEDDKDDEKAEDDDPEKKDDKAKSKGKASEDDEAEDDDDREEMHGTSSGAKARRRERARCAAIFASKAAARNPVLAANLAFSTSMTRKEALAVLEGTPAPAAASDRSARNPSLGAGGVTHSNSKQAVASQWDAAFAKATPRRK